MAENFDLNKMLAEIELDESKLLPQKTNLSQEAIGKMIARKKKRPTPDNPKEKSP